MILFIYRFFTPKITALHPLFIEAPYRPKRRIPFWCKAFIASSIMLGSLILVASVNAYAQSTSTSTPPPEQTQLIAKAPSIAKVQRLSKIQPTPKIQPAPVLQPIRHPQTTHWGPFSFWLSAVCFLSYLFVRAMRHEP